LIVRAFEMNQVQVVAAIIENSGRFVLG
jgi:8-oxo-dGTP diphosphatase